MCEYMLLETENPYGRLFKNVFGVFLNFSVSWKIIGLFTLRYK